MRGAERRRSFDGQFLLVVDNDLLVIDPSEYHTLKDKIGALMLNRFCRVGAGARLRRCFATCPSNRWRDSSAHRARGICFHFVVDRLRLAGAEHL